MGLPSALFARFLVIEKTLEEKRKKPLSFARSDAIFILFYACATKTKFLLWGKVVSATTPTNQINTPSRTITNTVIKLSVYHVFVLEQSHPHPHELSLAEHANPSSIFASTGCSSFMRKAIDSISAALSLNISLPPSCINYRNNYSCFMQLSTVFINLRTHFGSYVLLVTEHILLLAAGLYVLFYISHT